MRFLLGVVMIGLLTRPVGAEPPRPSDEPLPTAGVIAADALALGLVAGGYAVLRLDDARDCDMCSGQFGALMMAMGAATYVSIGPVAHYQRGHTARAVFDGTLRIALPVAAGLATARLTDREAPIVSAIGAGTLGAMALDWMILGHESSRAQPVVTTVPHGTLVGFALAW